MSETARCPVEIGLKAPDGVAPMPEKFAPSSTEAAVQTPVEGFTLAQVVTLLFEDQNHAP
ncbi:MAG TPA: hypothetical protein VGB52_05225 [Actinomycetota bacterium]